MLNPATLSHRLRSCWRRAQARRRRTRVSGPHVRSRRPGPAAKVRDAPSRRARAVAGEGAADWAAAGAPEALTPEKEAAQAAKAVRQAGPMLWGGCWRVQGVARTISQRWRPRLQQWCSMPLHNSKLWAAPLACAVQGSRQRIHFAGVRKSQRQRAGFTPEAPC